MADLEGNMIVNYLYGVVVHNGLTWEECAEILREDFDINISPNEIEQQFADYYKALKE